MNYILKLTGAVVPIDEVVCLDCNRYIWEELCDSYPEEFLVQLHEATILQLFILLPYIIEDAKVKSFDLLNQTEFVEKPGFISVLDDKGAVRSILRDGPLWGDELPSVIVPVSTSGGLVCVTGGEEITDCLASVLSTDDAAVRGCFCGDVVTVGDISHDMVVDMVVVDSPVVDLCQVAPVVVATPIAVVSCGKRKLPAKRSPAPVVRFFDPKSSAAKEEHLQLLESRRKILEERIEEISVYIEEGKNDLKYVSNFSCCRCW